MVGNARPTSLLHEVMHPNARQLIELLPPPESPRYAVGDWSEVERHLGTALPQDFKDLTEAYGAVSFCQSFWLHTPFYFIGESAYVPLLSSPTPYRSLLMSRLPEIDAVVDGRANVPYPDFPQTNGLLPIGANDNGDILAWITSGLPEHWGVFYWHFPGIKTFAFPETSLSQFLLQLLSLDSPLFPDVFSPQFFDVDHRRVDV
ncbi:MAG: hypothetical protein IT428_09350 [Planctomycetaceae bacterium]|nr:hypothetical protein [Planctomycetaceae bacterium]